MDPDFFDLEYISKIIDIYLKDEEPGGQILTDLYVLGNFAAIGLI